MNPRGVRCKLEFSKTMCSLPHDLAEIPFPVSKKSFYLFISPSLSVSVKLSFSLPLLFSLFLFSTVSLVSNQLLLLLFSHHSFSHFLYFLHDLRASQLLAFLKPSILRVVGQRVSKSFPHYNGCCLPPHLLLATATILPGNLPRFTLAPTSIALSLSLSRSLSNLLLLSPNSS